MSAPRLEELPPPPPGKSGWPWTEAPAAAPITAEAPGPRVTIVTPSYNQGRFIEETIRSVLLQGYAPLEYVVMDGGSTDGAVEIIRKYEPWLYFWTSGPDGGQSHAINEGWRRGTGEIVAWLNSDDVYEPGVVWKAVSLLAEHPDAGMVYGHSTEYDEEGRNVGKLRGRPFVAEEIIWGRNPVAQPSAFMRRGVIDRVGCLNESLHFAMDYDLWLRLGTAAPVFFVDEIWSRFRFYPQSKSGGGWLPFAEEIDRALGEAFRGNRLPPALHRHRVAALALSSARLAAQTAGAGRAAAARRHALRALRQDITLLGHPVWRRKLLGCLLGRRRAGAHAS